MSIIPDQQPPDIERLPRPDLLELLGYAGLENRVDDLERERSTYREMASVALEQLHQAHRREQRLREMVREQAATIRRLRSLVTVTSADRRAA